VGRESEAEAIAFVISNPVGPEAGTASADYIHLYHGNASLLARSLEVIQQTSDVILAALQPPNTKDQEPVLAEASETRSAKDGCGGCARSFIPPVLNRSKGADPS
jgi:hypothetical protein